MRTGSIGLSGWETRGTWLMGRLCSISLEVVIRYMYAALLTLRKATALHFLGPRRGRKVLT